jgi:quercetin dioxygenase-like cupin family protein
MERPWSKTKSNAFTTGAAMSGNFTIPASSARFSPDRFARQDLFSGSGLFLGLNCFEPGQVQASHAHAGQDKFYYVVSGRARITTGDESQEVSPGMLVWAPAGVAHGVHDVRERTIILVGIAPPPGPSTRPK